MATHAGVLFDVDGTLLDTNHLHVLAWELAFRDGGHVGVDMADLHRLIGRASNDLVPPISWKRVQGAGSGWCWPPAAPPRIWSG